MYRKKSSFKHVKNQKKKIAKSGSTDSQENLGEQQEGNNEVESPRSQEGLQSN